MYDFINQVFSSNLPFLFHGFITHVNPRTKEICVLNYLIIVKSKHFFYYFLRKVWFLTIAYERAI